VTDTLLPRVAVVFRLLSRLDDTALTVRNESF
jgi:hypothetical protein